jgi:hypothetical protein
LLNNVEKGDNSSIINGEKLWMDKTKEYWCEYNPIVLVGSIVILVAV